MTYPPPASAAEAEALRIEYVPRPGLLPLALLNALLLVLTLGFYRFWAKTKVRRHIWSCVYINGHPLEYTGTGMELFLGALLVFVVFLLPTGLAISALSFAYGPEHPAVAGVQLLFALLIVILWGAAVYRARRYQLSRTLWRGIRGALVGSTTIYMLTYFGSILARGMTLGWSTPVMNFNLQQQIISDMRFGDMPFRFKGRAGPLYPRYALCWLLMLVGGMALLTVIGIEIAALFGDEIKNVFNEAEGTPPEDRETKVMLVGVSAAVLYLLYLIAYPMIWALYSARELKLFASFTTIDMARFRLDATAGSLILLSLGNLLLLIFTLGIAAPFIQQRTVRYLCDRMTVEGTVDVDRIMQSKAPVSRTGEGLADAFDVGGI